MNVGEAKSAAARAAAWRMILNIRVMVIFEQRLSIQKGGLRFECRYTLDDLLARGPWGVKPIKRTPAAAAGEKYRAL